MPAPIGPRQISTITSPGCDAIGAVALDRGDRGPLAW